MTETVSNSVGRFRLFPISSNIWAHLTLPALVIVAAIIFGLIEPRFWRSANLLNILRNASFLSLVGAGQMLVLITGGLDLSIGAVIAFTSVTTALFMVALVVTFPDAIWLAIMIAIFGGLACGTLIGAANGIIVSKLRVPALMTTIGTWTVVLGLALLLTNGQPVYGLPDEFVIGLGRMRIWGVHLPVFVALAAMVVLAFALYKTKFGKYCYAIGSNLHAARVSGIATDSYMIGAYACSSLLAAITGVMLTARFGSGGADIGEAFILDSVAAAVIGGVSLAGGVGRLEFVIVGALLLAMITNGMNIIGFDSRLQGVVVGLIIIGSVAADNWRRSRKSEV